MMLTDYLAQLVAQRDRLNTAITALKALDEAFPMRAAADPPPAHHNGGRTPARGRPAAKQKPAGVQPRAKGGKRRRSRWDTALAEKLWKAGAETKEIARRAGTTVSTVYNRAATYGWGARQIHKRWNGKPSPRKSIPSRTDVSRRICEGCHQSSTTNPCHCGHIHGA